VSGYLKEKVESGVDSIANSEGLNKIANVFEKKDATLN